MFETVKLFGVVSRSEFIMPNLGSLIMGLAWGANPTIGLVDLAVLVIFSFTVINLSSAIGAQVNTLSDYELDLKDERKKQLVHALDAFGHTRLRRIVVAEALITFALIAAFALFQGKFVLLPMWVCGILLGWAYSAPPLMLKSRSWLAPVALILVLAAFPVFFAYCAFTFEVSLFFLLSLAGLALTVYAVIVPTEIRDYFGDKAMNIRTFTVYLGLAKASLLSITLLATGVTLTASAFVLEFARQQRPWLGIFVLAPIVAAVYVLGKLQKLHAMSKKYEGPDKKDSDESDIVSLSAHNPQWIMMVTQTYSALSILLLVSRFWP